MDELARFGSATQEWFRAAFAGPTGGGFDRTSGRSGIWSAEGTLLAKATAAPDDFARATFTKGSA